MSNSLQEDAQERLERLGAALAGHKRVLIIPHDFPDPDALATAYNPATPGTVAYKAGITNRLTINGYPAFTTHKNGMSTVVCTLDDWSSVLTVTGKGFSVDDLAQVAEGVRVR